MKLINKVRPELYQEISAFIDSQKYQDHIPCH